MSAETAPGATMPTVKALYRYPVKGLSPDPLDRVTLTESEPMPLDRHYAIENGPGRFDPLAPKHLPKINFLMLMRNERLAALETRFEEEGHTLSILRDGRQVARGALETPIGRQLIAQFFSGYLGSELRGAPRVLHAPGHSFSDTAARVLHIVNLATVRDLARTAGREIDPIRFRANVYVDGLAPWAEYNWLDRDVTAGGVTLRVLARTDRCDATNVDPSSGARDMAIPQLLERTYGHIDFGVYARVKAGGPLTIGDPVHVEGSQNAQA